MEKKISVVIVCKNEEHIIGKTLQSVQPIAGEVLVYDTGSTDKTIAIAEHAGARVICGPWQGYGKTKQIAISLAQNEWILNIDSDEVLDEAAQQSIQQLDLTDEKRCYRFKFKNFLGAN